MQKIYAVYGDYERESEFYSTRQSAEKALETIIAKYGVSDLTIRELSVYDYNMEEN